MRGKKRHNQLQRTRRDAIAKRVAHADFDVVVASPPCSTFSRARNSGRSGPRPLRSRAQPRGLAGLGKREKQSVKDSNVLIDFTIEVLTLQEKRGGYFLLEHPEDLGKRSSGQDPASVWQLKSVQELGRRAGVVTGALRQSDWGWGLRKAHPFPGALARLGNHRARRGGPVRQG